MERNDYASRVIFGNNLRSYKIAIIYKQIVSIWFKNDVNEDGDVLKIT